MVPLSRSFTTSGCRGVLQLRQQRPRPAVGLVRPVHAERPDKGDPNQPPPQVEPVSNKLEAPQSQSRGTGQVLLLGAMFAGWYASAFMSERWRSVSALLALIGRWRRVYTEQYIESGAGTHSISYSTCAFQPLYVTSIDTCVHARRRPR